MFQTISDEVVELMLRCWAEWTMTGKGGIPYDDTPRDPIYIGAEPVPDTAMMVEQALSELRQAEVGQRYLPFLELHYCHFNRPVYIKLNLARAKLKRRVSKDEFYNKAGTGRTLVHYELQQIAERGQRPHAALRRRKKIEQA